MLTRLIEARRTSPRLATQAAAIAAMLALCALLAPRVSGRVLMVMAAGLGGLALVGRIEWGLVLLIPTGLLVPLALGTGSGTEVPISLLLMAALLALWLLDMTRRRELRLASSPANLPLVALLAWAALSILVGGATWNPLVRAKGNFTLVQAAQWAVFALSAGAFWLTANVVRDVQWLKRMVALFLALGAAYVGLRLVGGTAVANRLVAAGSTGSLFWTWLVALSAGQVLFNPRLHPCLRAGLGALIGAALFVSIFGARSWVSGWGPALVALLVLVTLRSARWGLLLFAATAGLFLLSPGLFERILADAITGGTLTRLDAWRGIWRLLGNRWPVGLGLAAYVFYWTEMIGEWAYSPTNVVRLSATDRVNSHSNYIDILAQMGMVGLGILLWLIVALWREVWQARKAVPAGFGRAYIYGCIGGLAGSLAAGLLGDWFLPFIYNIGLNGMRSSLLMWIFLGGAVGLARLGAQAAEQPGGPHRGTRTS